MAELDLFRSALLADEPPFAVLHLHGPGGVGKTTLLREFARIAAECDRQVVQIDGRNVDPSPPGLLRAVRQATQSGADETSPGVAGWPANGVLLIDTYEMLAALDGWLRDTFLPQLPAETLVVIAGRNQPAPAWRTDLDWSQLTSMVAVGNLHPDESRTYLVTRGVPDDCHNAALAFTHGHPLALSLVADVLNSGDRLAAFDPQGKPDIVRVLLERLVQDVPSAAHRLALDICVLVCATTESLLAEVLEGEDAHALFDWLRRLSFIEHSRHGVYPHDIAREALYEDLRWRDPDGLRELNRRLSTCLHARVQREHGVDQQRAWLDLLYLTRHNPFMRSYFEWAAQGSAYAEPAMPSDHPAILAMVGKHQGDASARIAEYWLRRQPQSFLAYREPDGKLLGFMAQLALHETIPDDLEVDPAVAAAMAFATSQSPVRPGEEIIHLRYWMSADSYQDVSPAVNLTAINSSIYWMTHPRLAWNFITIANPDHYEPQFAAIHMWRSPEADFEVGGWRYAIFAHDWRTEPATTWYGVKTDLASPNVLPTSQHNATLAPPLVVLSQAEFAAAVRQALRDFTRPDQLASNPLMRSRLIVRNGRDATPDTLQALLCDVVATDGNNPRDAKFYRAIQQTYLRPAGSQEQVAELLDLPFNTYRYHLAKGIERVIERLWRRELDGPGG